MGEPQRWTVVLYAAADGGRVVAQEIRELGIDARAKVGRAIAQLQDLGLDAPARHLRDAIWELRPDAHRVLYFTATGRVFVVVRVFVKKTQKTPEREIRIAEARRADWESQREGA